MPSSIKPSNANTRDIQNPLGRADNDSSRGLCVSGFRRHRSATGGTASGDYPRFTRIPGGRVAITARAAIRFDSRSASGRLRYVMGISGRSWHKKSRVRGSQYRLVRLRWRCPERRRRDFLRESTAGRQGDELDGEAGNSKWTCTDADCIDRDGLDVGRRVGRAGDWPLETSQSFERDCDQRPRRKSAPARSISRRISRSLIVWRLSPMSLPRPSASSTFARPSLK